MVTADEHQRYLAYHAQVDLLIAEFIAESKCYLTKTTLMEWMAWSYQRTQQLINATTAPSGEIGPATIESPMVTRMGVFDMQVCVPADLSDAEVVAFAERERPCGTDGGWQIRREGDPALAGDPERNPCTGPRGAAFVHIMLDA